MCTTYKKRPIIDLLDVIEHIKCEEPIGKHCTICNVLHNM